MQSQNTVWTVRALLILLGLHQVLAVTRLGCTEVRDTIEFSYKLKDSSGKTIEKVRKGTELLLDQPQNDVDKILIGAGVGWAYPIDLTLWDIRRRLSEAGVVFDKNNKSETIEIKISAINGVAIRGVEEFDECGINVSNKIPASWSWFTS